MSLRKDYVETTKKGYFEVWADSAQSDNSGDGLTLATAKKDIYAAVALVPETIQHMTRINVRGTHDLGATLSSGTGDSLTVGSNNNYVTLVDSGASFTSLDVGRTIRLSGCSNSANNGSFSIVEVVNSTTLIYQHTTSNSAPVNETSSFSWVITLSNLRFITTLDVANVYRKPYKTENYPYYIVDGGIDEIHVLAGAGGSIHDTGANDYSSTAGLSSTVKIGSTGAGWTVNEFAGYILQITEAGTYNDYRRMILKNTADTLFLAGTLQFDPGDGTDFRIVRPKTIIKNSDTSNVKYVTFYSLHQGSIAFPQWITFDGNMSFYMSSGNYPAYISACVFNNKRLSDNISVHLYKTNLWSVTGLTALNPYRYNNQKYALGFSHRNGWMTAEWCPYLNLKEVFTTGLSVIGSTIQSLLRLGSLGPIQLHECTLVTHWDGYSVWASSGDISYISNPSGVGIKFRNCKGVRMDGAEITVENCASHGIELDNCEATIHKVAGTGNTGAGVYAHNNALIVAGTGSNKPTITGTVGDISSDGVAQTMTWNEIDTGVDYTDPGNLTIRRG